MTASRLDAALDALVALCAADSTLVGLDVLVSDGLPVTADYRSYLLVLGADPDGERNGASLTQEWHDSGSGSSPRRMEVLRISCYIAAWTGDVDVSTTRAAACSILAAVEALLRANRDLGLTDVIASSLTSITYSVSQDDRGTAVWLPFTVEVRSLI